LLDSSSKWPHIPTAAFSSEEAPSSLSTMDIDPITGRKLPSNAIQRVLFICPTIHIYSIPPLSSTKGYSASSWTSTTNPTAQEIFESRLRIRLIETAIPLASDNSIPAAAAAAAEKEKITVTLLVEDKSSGELFAAAPYSDPAAVEPAVDSSRFFAIRVVGEGGRKATLGLGFEERSEAVDFSIALQDSRRVLGWEKAPGVGANATGSGKGRRGAPVVQEKEEKRDFSLKEGETITVNIGGKFGRRKPQVERESHGDDVDWSNFALKPPPGSSGGGDGMVSFLPPPPSAGEVKADRGRRRQVSPKPSDNVKDLGFDDGEFGEFQ
jgi:adaptin ear-binding coat-associated protein 1/2